MSGDYDVVRGDSSSSISTTESFENVAVPGASESSVSRGSPVTTADSDSVELSEQIQPIKLDSVEDTNDQFFTPAHSRRAISLLIRFTAAMFVLPLLTMFTMYHYVFRDYFHLPPDQAMLYAGLCGIAVVIVIVALFVYIAYREEQEDEELKKMTKKLD